MIDSASGQGVTIGSGLNASAPAASCEAVATARSREPLGYSKIAVREGILEACMTATARKGIPKMQANANEFTFRCNEGSCPDRYQQPSSRRGFRPAGVPESGARAPQFTHTGLEMAFSPSACTTSM